MKITESRLRQIIKSVINESDMDMTRDHLSTARRGISLKTGLEHAVDQGYESPSALSNPTSSDDRMYGGYYFDERMEEEVRELANLPKSDFKDQKINLWCSDNDKNLDDFIYICKKINCI